MAEFSAGTVYVQVLPSLDGWRKAVLDQAKNIGDVKVHTTAVLHVDKSSLGKELADLKVKVTPEFETSSSAAKRQADRAAGAFADAFKARVASALKALPDVEMSAVDGKTVDVTADDHGSLNLLGSRMERLAGLIVAGSGAVGGLAAELLALGAGAVVGAAGLAAVAIGATAIGKALKAQTAASEQAGQTAAQEVSQRLAAANQVLNAQDALKAATASVADAQHAASTNVRLALEGETRAEERLQAAQASALRAQEELTTARQDAARSLEDLQNRVTDDALSQRQAVLDLEDAQKKLATVQADPGATERQRAEAQLNFEQASQHLAEISLSYQRSQVDASAAAEAGVEGSRQVVAAQDTILASQRDLREATVARDEAARKVDESRVDGAKQVAQAQQQVVHASRALTQAEAASATQAQHQGEAHQKFAEALDKLTPQSLQLVSYLRAQSGEWQSLTKASQGFAPGVQKGLQELEPSFGAINANVSTLSTSAGEFFHVIGKGLAGAQPFFDTIAASSQTLFPRFGETVNHAASAVGQLTLDMLPLAPAALDTVDAFSDLIKTWSPFIAQASGPLISGLQDLIKNLDFLGPLLVAVAKPAADLTNALVGGLREAFIHLTPELGPLLQSLVDLVKAISPLIGSAGELAAVLARDATPIIRVVTDVLKPLVSLVGDLVHLFALLPEPISGAAIAFGALFLAAGPIEKLLTKVGTGITGLGVKAGEMAIGLGASTTAASRFATAGERVGGVLSNVGKAIPVFGAILIGLGEAFAYQAEEARKAQEQADKTASALVAGGNAAVEVERRIRALRTLQQLGAAIGDDFARQAGQTADAIEESARRQEAALSPVELAQIRVAAAQRDYDAAVREFGADSAVSVEAHGRLVVAVDNSKRAQHDAAEATKTHTQRLQDQQDQILAMTDANVAKQRAELQLQRAQSRIDSTQTQKTRADKEAQQAKEKLSAAVKEHGKSSEEAQQAQLDYADALARADSAAVDITEAQLDLTSAQSRYVASSGEAAAATAKAGGAWDTSAAQIRGHNDALINLLRTEGEQLPPTTLSMLAHLDEAEKKFYGLTTTVDATGQTILTLPGGPGQPPVEIKFHDNVPEITSSIDDLQGKLTDFDKFLKDLLNPKAGVQPASLAGLLGLVPLGAVPVTAPGSAIPGTLGSVLGRASGGLVPGSGTGDSVPVMLTPGEFVWSRPAVNRVGVSSLAAMHHAAAQGYATGGVVGPLSFAGGGAVPTVDSGGSPLGWLAALVATTEQITGAVDPLALALRQRLVPALQDTITTSALLASGSVDHWAMVGNAVGTTTTAIVASYLPALQAGLSLVDAATINTAAVFATQWGAIRGYAADPIRATLAGPFDQGLIPAWNLIDSTFNVGKPLAPLAITFAAGGAVAGGQAGKDSVLAYLMPGEFVLPVSMVDQIGLGNLEAARRSVLKGGTAEGLIPGFEAGGAVSKALLFATSQVGKPYIWGAAGPDGYDCTGWLSALANVLMGLSPYQRRMTTGDFAPGRGAGGFLPGQGSAFVIGVSDSHAAGTLAGHNVESTTKNGISGPRVDGDASGALDPQFTKGQFYLPEAGGVFIPGPAGGGAPFDFAALLNTTFAGTRDAIAAVGNAFPGNTLAAGASAEVARMVDTVIGWASANLVLNAGVAGTGPVADQVRAVATRYGWGSGPQWDALSTLISHESGWNPAAQNPTSTAHGLFQFLDSTWGGYGIAKTDNPALQAEAGMRYIQARYGDPLGAWGFWSGHRWYDDGGYLPPGLSLAYNGTGRPEPVATPQQWNTLAGQKGGGSFTGTLVLDSGELLGVVRGEIQSAHDATGRALARRTRM